MKELFPSYTPWLGSLVVPPAHRKSGIASLLVGEVEALALERGFSRLYLQTEQQDGGLYARLGWERLHRLPYRGYQANVMTKALGRAPS